ncbi:MAG: hypothetical protein ABWZ88_21230 [Variovorax sp.]
MKTCIFRGLAIAAVAAALAGCGSTVQREAQWIDPTLGTQSRMLQGARVLVACDAYDVALRRICEDQLAREVAAKGGDPVMVPPGTALLNDRELDGQLVASAAALGARAVFVMTLTPATANWSPGVSLGIGGFSFGRGGGGGVGLSVPVGGGGGTTGFAANGRVTDASSGRLVWASTVVASPSSDLTGQVVMLSRSMLDAAQGAGLF